MKKHIFLIILTLFCINLLSYNSISDWRYIRHGRYTIYYPQGQYLYAKYTLNTLREYADQIDTITSNNRQQKLNIVLEDTGEYHNGLANPVENKLKLFLNSPSTHSTFTAQEWLNTLVIHEYTHHSHLTSANKTPLAFSKVFGNIFSPNLYSPMWMVEGITVRNESYFSPYMGRLNNSYYTEIIKAQLRENKFQNHIKANYYLDDFPLGNYYVYGGAFVKWLSDIYGEDQLTRFYNNYGSNLRNVIWSSLFPKYTLDRSAKKIFNKSFPELFTQWKNYLEMSANFDKEYHSNYLNYDWDNSLLVGNFTSDNDNLYFFETKNYFNHYRNNIISYNVETETYEKLYESNSSLSSNMELAKQNLYFAEEDLHFTGDNVVNMGYSGLSVLKKMDLENKKTSILFKKAFKDFTVGPNSYIYYTLEDNNTGTSSLYRYAKNHHSLIENYPFLLGELIYDNINNKIYCTYKYPNSSWDIGEISVIDKSFTPLITSYSQEKNISIHDNLLVFTSNQANLAQAYQYNLETKTINKISQDHYTDIPQIIGNKLFYKSISGSGERISSQDLVQLASDLALVEDSRLLTILDDEYEENKALGQSMKNLLFPYVRYPFGFFTSDGIGYFDANANWYLDSNGKGILGLNISTSILSPFRINLYLDSELDNYFSSQVDIYRSSISWLQNISLIGQTDFDDDYYLGNHIYMRKFNTSLINKYMRNLDNSGYTNKTIISHNLKKVQITGFYEKVEKFDESPNFSEFKIEDTISSYHDYGLQASFNLYKVRDGFWTPNVAMKDIDVNLGIFRNNYKSKEDITYYKISSQSIFYAASVLQFNIETGFYFNDEKIIPMLSFGTDF